jgi:hypothetical protein
LAGRIFLIWSKTFWAVHARLNIMNNIGVLNVSAFTFFGQFKRRKVGMNGPAINDENHRLPE